MGGRTCQLAHRAALPLPARPRVPSHITRALALVLAASYGLRQRDWKKDLPKVTSGLVQLEAIPVWLIGRENLPKVASGLVQAPLTLAHSGGPHTEPPGHAGREALRVTYGRPTSRWGARGAVSRGRCRQLTPTLDCTCKGSVTRRRPQRCHPARTAPANRARR